MGNSYGVYERTEWVNSILVPGGFEFVNSSTWVPPSQWNAYSIVIIADASPGVLTSASGEEVAAYLQQGGTLITVEAGLGTLFNLANGLGTIPTWAQSWIGATSIVRSTASYSTQDQAFPWPIDMQAELANPNWGTLFNMLRGTTATPSHKIIRTAAGDSVITVTPVGEGQLVHLGRMLFRVKAIAGADSGVYEEALDRMVRNLLPPRKPVLLMGNNYGVYERNAWVRSILIPARIDFLNSDEAVPPSEWSAYSTVVVADNTPLRISTTDSTNNDVLSFLQQGGTLITVEAGLGTLLGLPNGLGTIPTWAQPWIGATSIVRSTASYSTQDQAFPWPTDMQSELASPNWATTFNMLRGSTSTPSYKIIRTAAGDSVITVTPVGKGRLVHLGRMLFRLQGTVENPTTFDHEVYRKALEKTLSNICPARVSAIDVASVRAEIDPSYDWVIWRRDAEVDPEAYGYYDMGHYPRFSPPWPTPTEVVNSLEIELGRGEVCDLPFNIFALRTLSNLVVSVQNFPNALPANSIQVFMQKALAGSGSVFDQRQTERFWFVPVLKTQSHNLPQGDTHVCSLKFNTKNCPPGTYNFNLQVKNGTSIQTIPVIVRIAPVSLPTESVLAQGLYGFYPQNTSKLYWDTLQASGSMAVLTYEGLAQQPILDAAYDLGCRGTAATGMDINTVKVAATGKTLKRAMDGFKATPSISFLVNGEVPPLDFSGYDARVKAARDKGITTFHVRSSFYTSSLTKGDFQQTDWIEFLIGEPYVLEDGTQTLSPTWKKTFTGIWSQFATYLRGKGFTTLSFKYSDEMTPTEVAQSWVPVATLLKEAGWEPEINLTGASATNIATINSLGGLARSYQVNENYLDHFMSLLGAGQIAIDPSAVVSSYGSFGYWKSPSFYTRREWWECWAKRQSVGMTLYSFQYVQVFDGASMAFSGSADGLRMGWAEAVYLDKLEQEYLATASSTDSATLAWRGKVKDFLENSITSDPLSPPNSPYYHGMYWTTVPATGALPEKVQLVATTLQMELGRKHVLELLASKP